MKFPEILKVLDVLTWVEIVKTGDRTIFKGRLKDINLLELHDYNVIKVVPCATSRETYLEISVY